MVRKKHRYLLAEIQYENDKLVHPISSTQLYQEIRKAFHEGFGDYGLALVKKSLAIRFAMEETRMILVRIRRGAETMLSNTFMSMKTIDKVPMRIVTRHVSGSIRCAQKYWIRWNRRLLTNALRSCSGLPERRDLMEKIVEINKTDFSDLYDAPERRQMAKKKPFNKPLT